MSEPSWLEKLYLGAKRTIKTGYQRDKEGIKEVLNFFGCDSDSDIYKFMAKTAHIGEPIFSGITETAEFVAKNVDETGYLMSDMIGWAVEGDSIDSRRLLNYLYTVFFL